MLPEDIVCITPVVRVPLEVVLVLGTFNFHFWKVNCSELSEQINHLFLLKLLLVENEIDLLLAVLLIVRLPPKAGAVNRLKRGPG